MKTLSGFLLASAITTAPALAQNGANHFQVGDLVMLRVERESVLTDTFVVETGPKLRLPVIGEIPLAGVARTDLQNHMTRELGRFYRDPVVEARSLVRLSVVGEVAVPGWYPLRGDVVVTDAIMAAGGPTQLARMNAMRIERNGETLWEDDRLRDALGTGRTVDQMGLRSGDQIIIPRQRDTESLVRTVGVLVGIPVGIYTVIQLF
jgi:polysaccharide export outer membrane protein